MSRCPFSKFLHLWWYFSMATAIYSMTVVGQAITSPISNPTAEPEPTSESIAVSEPTSEPVAVSEPTSEPTAESEPTSESIAESEPTSEPIAESEPTSEPIAVTEPTSEPIAESEPTSEPIAESEPTSEPIAESKPTSEPIAESEPTSEPTAESEPTSEPIAESEQSADSEPTSQPMAESEPETHPEETPSPAEIVLPPLLLITIISTALILLAGYTRHWRYLDPLKSVIRKIGWTVSKSRTHHVGPTAFYSGHREDPPTVAVDSKRNLDGNCVKVKPMECLLTDFDIEVIETLRWKHNTARELIRIAFPAITSLALCPVTLFLFEPLTNFMWPKEKWTTRPDISDAIACYLAPAGLVYATSFGFAFQQALSKQHEILTTLIEEIGQIDHLATLTVNLNTLQINDRLKMLKAIKCETIFMMMQILEREPSSFYNSSPEDVRVAIWSVIDILRKVDTKKENHMNRLICKHILHDIKSLNSICSDRISIMHTRIHPVMWMFLETLGFCSFLGILLLTAFSYRMELLMCIVTVFSISLLCYVVSDLDSPFSGFFRVDLSVFQDLIHRLVVTFEMSKLGNGDIFYPEVRGLKSDVIG